MTRYDLHSHSTESDGVLRPGQVVARASNVGVDVLALTDHDTTEGLADAIGAAFAIPLKIIPGVEVSVTWQNRLVHIVGINIDPENTSLQKGLAGLRETRMKRAELIAAKLEKLGCKHVLEETRHYVTGKIISRTHFAMYLEKNRYVKDLQKAFKLYLNRGKKAYVACEWAGLGEVVDWIVEAGGQAVIAHPARYKMGRRLMTCFIDEFKEAGGVGIEVVTGQNNPQDIANTAKLSLEKELFASAGSDFHTPRNTWLELGKLSRIPDECVPIWQNWGRDFIFNTSEKARCAAAPL
ncbi:MAG: PHP domain-containing protein [Gammaproteobacteria bacterium]